MAASRGIYTGRAAKTNLYLLPDGRSFSRRTISKIRNNESGASYAAAQLMAHGASVFPESSDERKEWLEEWLPKLTRRVAHPGNHRYLFALQKKIELPASLPYPKVRFSDLQMPLAFA